MVLPHPQCSAILEAKLILKLWSRMTTDRITRAVTALLCITCRFVQLLLTLAAQEGEKEEVQEQAKDKQEEGKRKREDPGQQKQ
eukprot:3783530-Rhodomonas_salina.1